MTARAQTFAGAIFHARNIREGMKGAHYWREDLDVVSASRIARKNREANSDLYEKLGGDSVAQDFVRIER